MAITSIGASGTGTGSTSGSTLTVTTATNAFAAGDFAILRVATDNIATADGATNNHTGVTGWTGTVTKLGEYTNTVGGVAGDGVCTSLWLLEASGAIAVGTALTVQFSAATIDKCGALWKFTKAAGASVAVIGSALTTGTDASANPGSLALANFDSSSRLYIRGIGLEANTTTSVTVSTGFTALTATRSRNNAAAVASLGEFRINTSAGETSAPTLPAAGDNASVFVALQEYTDVSFPLSFSGGTIPSGVHAYKPAPATSLNAAGNLTNDTGDRLDYLLNSVYSATTSALLVEPAVKNWAYMSVDLSIYNADFCALTANAATDPYGTTTATKITEDSTAGKHHGVWRGDGSATAAGPVTASAWLKAGTRGYGYVSLGLPGGTYVVVVNLATGAVTATYTYVTVGGASYAVETWPNGWYRVSVTGNMTGSGSYNINVGTAASATPASFDYAGAVHDGDGSSYIFAFGPQLQDGAKATSYVPTAAFTSPTAPSVADVVTFQIPSGVSSLVYTFDDNSTQTVSVSSGIYTVPTTLNRARIKSIALPAVTHATSGTLSGQGSTAAGAAARASPAVTHATSGAPTGPGSSATGSATRFRAMAASGVLVAQGSALSGVSVRFRTMATSGALTGQGSAVTGSAGRTRAHPSSGSLGGPGSSLTGSAARFRAMTAAGALAGSTAAVAGVAARAPAIVSHDAAGTLTAAGAALSGSAARTHLFASSAALGPVDAAIAGVAARTRVHAASGALTGGGSTLAGASVLALRHATTAVLTGSTALLAGSAAHTRTHYTTAALIGSGAVITAAAFTPLAPEVPRSRFIGPFATRFAS